jgi:hypothetical protein
MVTRLIQRTWCRLVKHYTDLETFGLRQIARRVRACGVEIGNNLVELEEGLCFYGLALAWRCIEFFLASSSSAEDTKCRMLVDLERIFFFN